MTESSFTPIIAINYLQSSRLRESLAAELACMLLLAVDGFVRFEHVHRIRSIVALVAQEIFLPMQVFVHRQRRP